ncbi:MAG: hypothetical protein HY561_01585 [Gemmatimonadetes bacterium]|nr:hypothetical protein [Gemmatimonadota bacterium]
MPQETAKPQRRVRTGRPVLACLLSSIVLLGACEGDNLFGGREDGGGGAPQVTSLTVPDSIRGGDVLDIRITAAAPLKVAKFTVAFRRALLKDTTVTVATPLTEVTQDVSIIVPDTARDSLLVINVTATDQVGKVSEIRSDTVRVRDASAPSVTAAIDSTTVTAGQQVSISITARDNVALDSLGYLMLRPPDTLKRRMVQVAGGPRQDSLLFVDTIPADLRPTTIKIVGLAVDLAGARGTSDSVAVSIVDRVRPSVTILAPTISVSGRDSVEVKAQVRDTVGVSSVTMVGEGVRGDPELGTDEVIVRFRSKEFSLRRRATDTLPRDTVVRRFLQAVNDTVTVDSVRFVVTALDSAGNSGTDTTWVLVGGPIVRIESPPNNQSVSVGGQVAVRLNVSDPLGIDSLRVNSTGVFASTKFTFSPAATDTTFETTLAVATTTQDTFRFVAQAWNTKEIPGISDSVSIIVVATAPSDTEAPTVTVKYLSPTGTQPRLELTDTVQVEVAATDNTGGSGVVRIGFTVLAKSTGLPDTVSVKSAVGSVPISGLKTQRFTLRVRDIYTEVNAVFPDTVPLPDSLILHLHGYAVDDSGNCAVGVDASGTRRACATFRGVDTVATTVGGLRQVIVSVVGRTVLLPSRGTIADAVVDTTSSRQRLYLSNFTFNKVDVLDLPADTFFSTGVLVGSQPWGMFLNRRPDGTGTDTLIVGNSGGTNVSFVSLAGTPREAVSRRLRTPNTTLYQLSISVEQGLTRYTLTFIDFSDRPQFVAQDSTGRIIYSTVPTGSAPDGTIRYTDTDPDNNPATGDTAEVKLLFNDGAVEGTDAASIVIANVDSVETFATAERTGSDVIQIWSHIPGRPNRILQTPQLPIDQAIDSLTDTMRVELGNLGILRDSLLYFPYSRRGKWNVDEIGMSDTTFVSASGDRGVVAFGEGATAPTGRIILWDAARASVSDEVNVQDLIGNASERVVGVGLNVDGSLGVARGEGAYFFSPDLRLQGIFTEGLGTGGAGAALHPLHPNYFTASDTDPTTVAFIGTGNQSVKIVDTIHFFAVEELLIRDTVVGPLRASPAMAFDRAREAAAGLTCPGSPQCTAVKLFGVTSAGGVVVINVKEKDLVKP